MDATGQVEPGQGPVEIVMLAAAKTSIPRWGLVAAAAVVLVVLGGMLARSVFLDGGSPETRRPRTPAGPPSDPVPSPDPGPPSTDPAPVRSPPEPRPADPAPVTPSPEPASPSPPQPEPAPPPEPTSDTQVRSAGELSVPLLWTADLDEGEVPGFVGEADIQFEAASTTQRFLTPQNGALLASWGSGPVGREACVSAVHRERETAARIVAEGVAGKATAGASRIAIEALRPGFATCVRTNRGRYSAIQAVDSVGPRDTTLRIRYTTWEND